MPLSSVIRGQVYSKGQALMAAKTRQLLHHCTSPHIPSSFFLHIPYSVFTNLITSLRQFPACHDSLTSWGSSTLSIPSESRMLSRAAWVQVTGDLQPSNNSMGHELSKTSSCLLYKPEHAPTCRIVLGHNFLSNILCISEQKKEFPLCTQKSSPVYSSLVLSAFLLQ